jgi:hypothetical protein
MNSRRRGNRRFLYNTRVYRLQAGETWFGMYYVYYLQGRKEGRRGRYLQVSICSFRREWEWGVESKRNETNIKVFDGVFWMEQVKVVDLGVSTSRLVWIEHEVVHLLDHAYVRWHR